MRSERIVHRQGLKKQLATLKDVMKNAQPLIEADKKLRQAFIAGYRKRLLEEIEEHKSAQEGQVLPAEQPIEPRNDPQDNGSAQPDQQSPVSPVLVDDGVHL